MRSWAPSAAEREGGLDVLGVTIGGKHTWWDWGLVLRQYPEITPPSPKTKIISIPGADGVLDLSTALTGYVLYENRTITFEFTIMKPRDMWPATYSEILDHLHGRELEIIMDDDREHYYKGRVQVTTHNPEKVTAGITLKANVEPYKTRCLVEQRSATITGSGTLTIVGKRKPVIPTIKATADMKMTFGGRTYDLTAGENRLPEVVMLEGENMFTFTGTGTVTFEYREGRL